MIPYQFRDPQLEVRALTHKSFSNEVNEQPHNEVLEFIGDSVVNLVVGHLLFDAFAGDNEGDLSRKRASLVNEAALCELALILKLDERLRLGRGEQKADAARRPRLLASAFEALVGAIYMDGGYEAAKTAVEPLFHEKIQTKDWSHPFGGDFKTRLQEKYQKEHGGVPVYIVAREDGPAHRKVFDVEVCFKGRMLGKGQGMTKKEAEQMAARYALGEPSPSVEVL